MKFWGFIKFMTINFNEIATLEKYIQSSFANGYKGQCSQPARNTNEVALPT